MPRNPINIITLACIVAVVAGYFLFQLGSARLAQEEKESSLSTARFVSASVQSTVVRSMRTVWAS